jgi:hypothetical protein
MRGKMAEIPRQLMSVVMARMRPEQGGGSKQSGESGGKAAGRQRHDALL